MVPGGANSFATVVTCPGVFRGDGSVPEQKIALTQLCNSDPSARLKFVFRNRTDGREFNSFETSLEQLQAGNTTLNGTANSTLVIDNLQVKTRPNFLDYLRSGW